MTMATVRWAREMATGDDDNDGIGATGDKVEDDGGGMMGNNNDDNNDGNAMGDSVTGYNDDNYGCHYWGNGDGE